MVETGPKQIEFGHVCENPNEWEQRYERKDEEKKHYQGKVELFDSPYNLCGCAAYLMPLYHSNWQWLQVLITFLIISITVF